MFWSAYLHGHRAEAMTEALRGQEGLLPEPALALVGAPINGSSPACLLLDAGQGWTNQMTSDVKLRIKVARQQAGITPFTVRDDRHGRGTVPSGFSKPTGAPVDTVRPGA